MKKLQQALIIILSFIMGVLAEYGYFRCSVDSVLQKDTFFLASINDDYLTKDVNLVVYLSSTCQTCIQTEKSMRKLSAIFEDFVDVLLVFKDEAIYDTTLPYIMVTSEQHVAEQYPYFFVVDSNRHIILATSDGQLVVDQIFERILAEPLSLEKYAINYLHNQYANEKDVLIYFAMTGCPDCEMADKILIESDEINEKYTIMRIYRYNETDETKETDKFKILQKALNINWYPTFVKLYSNGQHEIVRKVQFDQLEKIIMDDNGAVKD